MAVTTLTTINKVLRGLRQFGLLLTTGATSTTDDYILMILQFVNEAKEEIEEAGWPWQALRQTVTVTLSSGTAQVDLLSASEADVDTNDRTRLLYETRNTVGVSVGFYNGASSLPMVFDTTDSSEERLREVTQERMESMHFTDNDETGQPEYFAIWSDSDSIKMKVYPTPDATYTIKMRMYIPQAELASNSLTATTLSIPTRPVWLLALWKANQERGEELGREGSSLHRAYLDAHGAAQGKEMTPADQTVFLER
jgi:hypothetical protein